MPLFPGSTIGVIGGGQLGRMLILECRRMGYHSAVIDPDITGPAGQVADRSYRPEDVSAFLKECDVATYEFEHLDINMVREIEDKIAVYPGSSVLEIKRNRISEKRFLSGKGFPLPEFRIAEDYNLPPSPLAPPFVVKKSCGGYDGKGLYIIRSKGEYDDVRGGLREPFVMERFVPYVKELSVICARNGKGEIALYPVVENVHDNGILLYTIAPAGISAEIEKRARDIASDLAEALGIVGLLVVEMFLTEGGEILINEFAPRPHNSGHYSMDACDVSQFETLLRAICGLPLVEPRLLTPSAMLNILGKGESDLGEAVFSLPGTKLHLYGKKDARDRRKMGHLNILGETPDDVRDRLRSLLKVLYGREL